MQGLNSIAINAEKKKIHAAIFLKNKYLKVSTYIQNRRKLKDMTLAINASNIKTAFLDDLENIDMDKIKSYQILDNYFIVTKPIKDFDNNIVAYAFIGEELERVNETIDSSKSSLITQIFII